METENKEYASKGVAGTGLGLGIAGTALALLNGGLGNLGLGNWGGRMGPGAPVAAGAELQYVSQLQSENAQLKAEKNTDAKIVATYQQTLADNSKLRDEVYAYLTKLTENSHNTDVSLAKVQERINCCCEKQELEKQIMVGKINEATMTLNGKIDTTNAQTNGAMQSLANTLSCVSQSVENNTRRLNAITNEIIPLCKVCPQPMQRFNTWATPTTTAPDCTGSSCNCGN